MTYRFLLSFFLHQITSLHKTIVPAVCTIIGNNSRTYFMHIWNVICELHMTYGSLYYDFMRKSSFSQKAQCVKDSCCLLMSTNINTYTVVLNDPLGQTHSHASSEHCFLLFCFSSFEKWGRTYGEHEEFTKQWSLPAVTMGWPSGSIHTWLCSKKRTKQTQCTDRRHNKYSVSAAGCENRNA